MDGRPRNIIQKRAKSINNETAAKTEQSESCDTFD